MTVKLAGVSGTPFAVPLMVTVVPGGIPASGSVKVADPFPSVANCGGLSVMGGVVMGTTMMFGNGTLFTSRTSARISTEPWDREICGAGAKKREFVVLGTPVPTPGTIPPPGMGAVMFETPISMLFGPRACTWKVYMVPGVIVTVVVVVLIGPWTWVNGPPLTLWCTV